MALKDIVVFVDGGRASEHRLELACRIAGQHQAHLAAVHLQCLPNTSGFGRSGLHQQVHRAMAEAATARAAASEQAFRAVMARETVDAEWRLSRIDLVEDGIVHARHANLAIIGQSDPDDQTLFVRQLQPEEAMMAAGRPVLIVPYAGRFERVGERILIGWNASREAARAVNDALPLLRRARAVTVLSVNPQIAPDRHGEIPGADIALHLARHGLKVTAETSRVTEIDASDLLLNRASDLGADLIVVGGYGRSRLRELVLGGVTRDLLRRMTVPVLMSH